MVDFAVSPEMEEIQKQLTAFMDEYVYAAESQADEHEGLPAALERELQDKVKALGLWAPHMPKDAGGMGISVVGLGLMNEIIGRSPLGPRIFGCAAPDAGNAELLHIAGSPAQQAQYLKPLVAGEIRSCFAMTEPEVAGSDPTGLRARAELHGDHWVINGHKWFITGAKGADFAIVMAVTDPDAKRHKRASMIIVPAGTVGFNIVREVPVMEAASLGGHCEIRFEDCYVPRENIIGVRGQGFQLAQARLGPGRIQHCMRWLGIAQRSFEMMCKRALTRNSFGEPLANKQTVQNWKMDRGEDARVEISLIKFYGARMLHEVIDRAIQVHGALGYSKDTPLEMFYRGARAARIYDGPDEVHRMVVARRILEQFAEPSA
jgi:acyl-CoA dehydrogenase